MPTLTCTIAVWLLSCLVLTLTAKAVDEDLVHPEELPTLWGHRSEGPQSKHFQLSPLLLYLSPIPLLRPPPLVSLLCLAPPPNTHTRTPLRIQGEVVEEGKPARVPQNTPHNPRPSSHLSQYSISHQEVTVLS